MDFARCDAITGGIAMPTKLPNTKLPKRNRVLAIVNADSQEWLIVWALSIGFSALLLAAILYFDTRDNITAAMVLLFAAAIMILVLNHDIDRRRGE
jgi:hypothetical protein